MDDHKTISKYYTVLILLCITIFAGTLRLYGLDKQSLRYDEVIEEENFLRLLNQQDPDVTPPLNSFFVYLMTLLFSKNDFALRLVPFISGLISVPLLFLLGRGLFNERMGFIVSFLLAISPFHIWYSQDARMYALQWMFVLISLIYFLRLLEVASRGNYAGYIISTSAALYTHQLSIFLVLTQALYLMLFLRHYRKQILKWTIIFVMLAILYLPWLIYSSTSLIDKAGSGFPMSIDYKVILFTIFSYSAGFNIGPSLSELHINMSWTAVKPYLSVIVPLMAVYCTLFVLGLWSSRKDRSRLILLILLFIVPITSAFLLPEILPRMAYNVRYTGTALFVFLLFVAKGVDRLACLKPKMLGMVLTVCTIIALTGFSAYSYVNYQFDKKYHKADTRGAAAYISKERIKGDIVLCVMDSSVINRYARGSFQCSQFKLHYVNDKEILALEMQKIVEGKNRLWLLLSSEWYNKNIGNVKAWLDTNYEEIEQLHKGKTDIANVRIYCYDLTKKKHNIKG